MSQQPPNDNLNNGNGNNNGRRRCTTREVLDAARGRWPEIYARIAPAFREAIEYAGGSKHVDCPVKPGKNGDGFRMFPDWRDTGGVVCNSCGEFPTGLTALNWVNNWNNDHSIAEIAAVLGIDGPKRGRGRPPKPKTIPQPSQNGHAGHHSTNGHTPGADQSKSIPAQTIEIAKIRNQILSRWQSSIPDTGRIAQYFAHRGLSLQVPPTLKLAPALPYYHDDPADPKKRIEFGQFPAMLAIVHHPSVGIVAIHRTYLANNDDTNSTPGKAQIGLQQGESLSTLSTLPTKKLSTPIYQGATSGAAIRLYPAIEIVALAEGIETALAIHQATATPAWSTVSAGGLGSIELPKEIATVEIWADPGDVGQQKAKQAAERLAAEGRVVRVISPPPEHADAGHDWLDILISDGTEALTAAREDAQEFRRATGEVRDIYIRPEEKEVVDEIIEAIANDPEVYSRGGQLVRVVNDFSRSRPGILRPSVAPRISVIPESQLRQRITTCCRFIRRDSEGNESTAHPIQWMVAGLSTRGKWPSVRHLEAIVETPILRHDGEIFSSPGYDPISGVYYDLDPIIGNSIPAIPPSPTITECQTAVATIFEVVKDFPFATPAHQSAWLAAVLTPFARFAFRGPAPLFLIDANVRGAGKSLLCDLIGLIVSGREMARMVNTSADDEMRKRITSIAIAGDQLILIDNVADRLGGPALDAALTASTWSDRVLGKLENTPSTPLCATWYATGNNVILKSDLARRICHIRLDSPEENPEERQDFTHRNIRGHVFKNRPALIAACLTILRHYMAAISESNPNPKPRPQFSPWGSFEGWSDIVRGAIIFAGMADPGETRQQVREESDSEGQQLKSFMSAWEKLDPNNSGMTISEAIKRVDEFRENNFDNSQEIKSAFIEFAFSKDGKSISARSIGAKLHHIKGRVLNGKSFTRKNSVDNSIVWSMRSITGSTGNTGSTFSQNANCQINSSTLVDAFISSNTVEAETTTRITRTTRQSEIQQSLNIVEELI